MRGAAWLLTACTLISTVSCELPGPVIVPDEPQLTMPVPVPAQIPSNRFAEYETEYSDQIDGTTVTTLKIRSGRGRVKIIGDPAQREIAAVAQIYTAAENRAAAKRIATQLNFRFSSRDTQNPELIMPEPDLLADQDYRADLIIHVPCTVVINVENLTGDVELRGFTEGISLNSRQGRIEIHDVQGGVRVATTGHECEIQQATGLIDVQDGGGDLYVSFVTGEVRVRDGKGILKVHSITGNVLATDNPGAPEFFSIDGTLTLRNIAHDRAKVRDVSGAVVYPASGK